MLTFEKNTFSAAVLKEAENFNGPNGVASMYAAGAAELAALVSDGAAVHLYLSAGQDNTTDPAVWKRSFQGMKDALAPLGYAITGSRDFRPAYRKRNALFTVALLADVKAERETAAAAAAEQAAAIEKAHAESVAAAAAAADAATTAADIAAAAAAECGRLGLSVRAVVETLILDLGPADLALLADMIPVQASLLNLAPTSPVGRATAAHHAARESFAAAAAA